MANPLTHLIPIIERALLRRDIKATDVQKRKATTDTYALLDLLVEAGAHMGLSPDDAKLHASEVLSEAVQDGEIKTLRLYTITQQELGAAYDHIEATQGKGTADSLIGGLSRKSSIIFPPQPATSVQATGATTPGTMAPAPGQGAVPGTP